jgi:hypothetical protein
MNNTSKFLIIALPTFAIGIAVGIGLKSTGSEQKESENKPIEPTLRKPIHR